jgi:SanA protein
MFKVPSKQAWKLNLIFPMNVKKILLGAFVLTLGLILLIWISNTWVVSSTEEQLYSDSDSIPANDVALLLGASKTTRNGLPNLFFQYRMEAAARLYHAGKIKHIIVSGDNHKKEYDEATDMCDALISLGVPDSCITLDYAGFRTLDSMVRCLKVFGRKKITVISQEFHNQRAIFIGNYYDMECVAFNAKDVPSQYAVKTKLREYIAKFKAVLDLYVLQTKPKFLGKEEKLNSEV